jgi:hypothetical protein
MEAKVEVIYGTAVKERILQKEAFNFDLPLSREYENLFSIQCPNRFAV